MKIYWFGYGGSSYLAEELRPPINILGMTLITISEWENSNIKWNRDTWLGHLKQADIIICPANYKIQPAKSANRVTQALSLGKPVVASPLDAYLKILDKHPGSFLIASTPDEWKQQLQTLRDSEELRVDLSKKAFIAAQDYSIETITNKWIDIIAPKPVDKTDIIIPTYKNLRGIKLCLDSIKYCTDSPYNIIVVNNGWDKELHKHLSQRTDIQYIKTPSRMNFSQAVNIGIKAGTGKYMVIMNDDVIVSKGWLNEMIKACADGVGAVGPLSNCDKGWRHNYDINIGGVELVPGTNTFEQIEPIIYQIYGYKSPYQDVLERDWVALYATLIPRAVIDRVGLLNEDYTNSGEDVDLCRRIKKCGFRIVDTHEAFIFHFGAVSRKMLEQEDKGSYQEADKKTNQLLNHIWGKESVVIYSGPSWEAWSFKSLETGIGGSEVWQIWLSRELSKLGYRVTSFADTRCGKLMDGDIEWLPYTDYNKWVGQHWTDYFISSRTTAPFGLSLRAGKTYVQLHDIWALDRKEDFITKGITKFCALSDWHLKFASNHHGVSEDKWAVMANGIDFNRFDSIQVVRNPYRLHWSSSWDRGLDNVLYLWPFIKKEIPEAELHVFYGVFNWKSACQQRGDTEGLKKIATLEELVKQPGVFTYGRVNQHVLAEEIKKASLLLSPGAFTETFYITGIEAQYSGVPIICNKLAGVTTTFRHPGLGDTAIMLGNGEAHWPYSKEGREQFLTETISILKDKDKWNKWSELGRENAKRYSWANVALMWQKLFNN